MSFWPFKVLDLRTFLWSFIVKDLSKFEISLEEINRCGQYSSNYKFSFERFFFLMTTAISNKNLKVPERKNMQVSWMILLGYVVAISERCLFFSQRNSVFPLS